MLDDLLGLEVTVLSPLLEVTGILQWNGVHKCYTVSGNTVHVGRSLETYTIRFRPDDFKTVAEHRTIHVFRQYHPEKANASL